MSEKIEARHLARGAILYVRQSSQHQLQHNEESRRLQYAMADRLRELGWRDVETIDEDLGKSAAGATVRSGFQRLVSDVSLGKVGAIGARELSRFARNSVDWQRLMEVCRYVDTLLVDHDAVYDLRKSNDRLLLGLKGNLNEYELDLLRLRAFEAKKEKARRGEYYGKIAVGYRKTHEGGIEKHPDARVQHTINLVFEKMLELGSARQVLLWIREHQIEVPINRNDRGEVIWKSPRYGWLHMVLTNPIYAGSYVYGRTMQVTTLNEDGSKHHSVKRRQLKDASVLLHDRHDGYIAPTVFERIQTMITRNSQIHPRPGPGAARVGPALLAGLLRCRRCGEKLIVNYGGSTVRVHRYECSRANLDRGEARCINFSGLDVDARICEVVLEVVQPAAIEVSAKLARDDVSQRDAAIEALSLELKAARYAAERAERQYDAAEPENRLVVDELERRWNVALERVRTSEARLDEARATVPRRPVDVSRFASLGNDLARIWHAPTTDNRLKKRIIRTLIVEIVADTTEREVSIVVHWRGGVHTELVVTRRRRGENRTQTQPELVEAIRLLARVSTDEQIARALNASAVKTARGNLWTSTLVRSFRSTHRIVMCSNREDSEWLTLSAAAKLAGVADVTLRGAIERGVVAALRPVARGPWILEKAHVLQPDVLDRITKKPRARVGERAARKSAQLNLTIPRT
jgi:DNA invertase Pin-like site-specific DNA recombinase